MQDLAYCGCVYVTAHRTMDHDHGSELKTGGTKKMDAKELGTFIAKLRKEKEITQAELAKRLHVTDKAVSRWERGLGFPDIHTLEPLADALGVSLSELMQCERQPVNKEADQGILASIDIAQRQRTQVIRRVIIGVACCVIGLLVGMYAIHLFMTGSFSLISSGGDGATAVFVAGRISRWIPATIFGAGVILFVAGVWMLIHSANNDR